MIMIILQAQICAYTKFLIAENKTHLSIKEHIRYTKRFVNFIDNRPIDKNIITDYRTHIDQFYTTYNGKNRCIAYVNAFLKFLGQDALLMPYFEVNRKEMKLKTPALTDEDITKLLAYAENIE